ncbi:MAG: hypothetical protein M3Q93_08980, partial [Gemmatimonadota bacterium]|nr:hypothetical protein [Gemmatimonadota bacterium]
MGLPDSNVLSPCRVLRAARSCLRRGAGQECRQPPGGAAPRRAAREVDLATGPVNAIVSVLMLREGWDVQNVTVIVGLRPYSSKANILPEQT